MLNVKVGDKLLETREVRGEIFMTVATVTKLNKRTFTVDTGRAYYYENGDEYGSRSHWSGWGPYNQIEEFNQEKYDQYLKIDRARKMRKYCYGNIDVVAKATDDELKAVYLALKAIKDRLGL